MRSASRPLTSYFLFFSTHPAPTEVYTLSLHDALPISWQIAVTTHLLLASRVGDLPFARLTPEGYEDIRSEEHTSELQSRGHLVCRLLLEKKKMKTSFAQVDRTSRGVLGSQRGSTNGGA